MKKETAFRGSPNLFHGDLQFADKNGPYRPTTYSQFFVANHCRRSKAINQLDFTTYPCF